MPSRFHPTPRGVVLLAAFLAFAPAARAQQPATAPATAPAVQPGAAGDATVVVTAVEGKAQARMGPAAQWQLVTQGMRLPVGAEITTGPRARVTCSIPPGEDFVVDRMSNVTVVQAQRRGNRQQTRLAMEYGRTAARVQAAGIEHDMRIQTPATTASVRGTEYTVDDQPPFAPELRTYTGLVDYRFAKRQVMVGKGGHSQGGRGSAETALLESVVDPSTSRARTNADAALIASEVSRGAVLTYNPTIRLNEIRGGAGPQSDEALINSLPGRLNFVVRWNQNVDVDIFVSVQPGDQLKTILEGKFNPHTFLYPGLGLQTTTSGGRVPFNHRGGPNGGQEICFWPGNFPTAVYGFSALNNSTTDSADVRFNAYLDGEKISLFALLSDEVTLIRTKGLLRTVAPNGAASAIVLAPPNEIFESFPEDPDETVTGQSSQVGTPPVAAPVKAQVATSKAGSRTAAKAAQASKSARAGRRDRQPQSAFVPVAPRPAARRR